MKQGLFYPISSARQTEVNPYGFTEWNHKAIADDFIQSHNEHGYDFIVRHRPFGEAPPTASDDPVIEMDLDAGAQIARDREWSHILDAYDEQTERIAAECPDAIVIDYLGTVEDDLESRLNSGKYSQLWHRLWRSVRRTLDHRNVWVALDASATSRYPDGGPLHGFAEFLHKTKKHQGCDIVVEALPYEYNDWPHDHHALMTERYWQNHSANPNFNDNPRWRKQSDAHHTFRVLTPAAYPGSDDPDAVEVYLRSCDEMGHIPVLGVHCGHDRAKFAQQWKEIQR